MAGSYGEGAVQDIYDQLEDLKSKVQSGSLNLVDFQGKAAPLVKKASEITGQIAGKGGSAANAVNPIWQKFQSDGYVTAQAGKWVPQLPFSQQEYAKLPNAVLPTQDDITKGVFDPNAAPMQRIQTPGGGSSNNPANGVPAVNPALGPNGQPLPGITPTVPAGVDTRTGQGAIDLQGAQNAAQLQDALNKQFQINQQAVGQLKEGIAGIPDVFRQEGTSQQQQLQALADQQKSSRSQSLTDLGGILAQNQQNQFNAAIPDLAEQANTAGMYRSTGFGNILAQKYAQLTANTQNQLAQQGISDRESYLQAQQGALNTQLGFSGQGANAQATGMQTGASAGAGALQAYGSGLGDVANAQIGMQNAGLQRQFSLTDYATQYQNALNLANQAKVQGPTGKASPGTQSAIQTGLGITNTATQAYSAGHPQGKAG